MQSISKFRLFYLFFVKEKDILKDLQIFYPSKLVEFEQLNNFLKTTESYGINLYISDKTF